MLFPWIWLGERTSFLPPLLPGFAQMVPMRPSLTMFYLNGPYSSPLITISVFSLTIWLSYWSV
jgi:hypothetical protein